MSRSRLGLSLRAVTAALEWQRAHRPEPASLFTGEETDALGRALGRAEALSADRFDTLVRLGLGAFRCARTLGAPLCTLGDTLTVAAALPAPPGEPAWSFDASVSAEVLEKLRFRRISDGIVRIQRENAAGWAEHAQASRRFILRTAEEIEGRSLAVLLGAGQTFDLPITELARRFDRLVLIDIDEVALSRTIDAVEDPGLRAKLEPRVMDVTGINGSMVRRIDEAFAAGGSGPQVEARLGRICRSYRLFDGPALLGPHEHADLLVSGLLLSQVAWPQRPYAHRQFSASFGRPTGLAERRWIAPFWMFELLVQQDHINALTRAADRVVLISDIVNVPTMCDLTGRERDIGVRVRGLGVDALAERVPQFLRIEGVGEWSWPRYRPDGSGRPGSRMEVEALVLHEAAPA